MSETIVGIILVLHFIAATCAFFVPAFFLSSDWRITFTRRQRSVAQLVFAIMGAISALFAWVGAVDLFTTLQGAA